MIIGFPRSSCTTSVYTAFPLDSLNIAGCNWSWAILYIGAVKMSRFLFSSSSSRIPPRLDSTGGERFFEPEMALRLITSRLDVQCLYSSKRSCGKRYVSCRDSVPLSPFCKLRISCRWIFYVTADEPIDAVCVLSSRIIYLDKYHCWLDVNNVRLSSFLVIRYFSLTK